MSIMSHVNEYLTQLDGMDLLYLTTPSISPSEFITRFLPFQDAYSFTTFSSSSSFSTSSSPSLASSVCISLTPGDYKQEYHSKYSEVLLWTKKVLTHLYKYAQNHGARSHFQLDIAGSNVTTAELEMQAAGW